MYNARKGYAFMINMYIFHKTRRNSEDSCLLLRRSQAQNNVVKSLCPAIDQHIYDSRKYIH